MCVVVVVVVCGWKSDRATMSEPEYESLSGKKRTLAAQVTLNVFLILSLIYLFLFGLTLMESAFKVLGGRNVGSLFSWASDPIAGFFFF